MKIFFHCLFLDVDEWFFLHRIFSGASKGQKNTQWISPRSQLAICSGSLISMPGKPVPTKTADFLSNRKVLIAKFGPLIKQGMGKASLLNAEKKKIQIRILGSKTWWYFSHSQFQRRKKYKRNRQ